MRYFTALLLASTVATQVMATRDTNREEAPSLQVARLGHVAGKTDIQYRKNDSHSTAHRVVYHATLANGSQALVTGNDLTYADIEAELGALIPHRGVRTALGLTYLDGVPIAQAKRELHLSTVPTELAEEMLEHLSLAHVIRASGTDAQIYGVSYNVVQEILRLVARNLGIGPKSLTPSERKSTVQALRYGSLTELKQPHVWERFTNLLGARYVHSKVQERHPVREMIDEYWIYHNIPEAKRDFAAHLDQMVRDGFIGSGITADFEAEEWGATEGLLPPLGILASPHADKYETTVTALVLGSMSPTDSAGVACSAAVIDPRYYTSLIEATMALSPSAPRQANLDPVVAIGQTDQPFQVHLRAHLGNELWDRLQGAVDGRNQRETSGLRVTVVRILANNIQPGDYKAFAEDVQALTPDDLPAREKGSLLRVLRLKDPVARAQMAQTGPEALRMIYDSFQHRPRHPFYRIATQYLIHLGKVGDADAMKALSAKVIEKMEAINSTGEWEYDNQNLTLQFSQLLDEAEAEVQNS